MATIANLNILLTAGLASSVKSSFRSAKAEVTGLAASASEMGAVIGEAVSTALGPIGLIIGAITGIGEAISEATHETESIKKLNAVLTATGNTTGFTSAQLQEMAESLQKVTNFSHTATESAMAVLATFHNISGETFENAVKAAMDLTSIMGGDLQDNIRKVGRALDNPLAGMKALSRLGIQFTEQQKKSIADMMAKGDISGAQGMILGQLQGKFGGAAQAMANPWTQFKNSLGDMAAQVGQIFISIRNAFASAVLPMVGIFHDAFAAVVPVVQGVMAWLGGIVSSGISAIVGFVVPAWQAMTQFLSDAIIEAVNIFGPIWASEYDLFSDVITAMIQVGEALWQGLVSVFTSLADFIGGALSAIGINSASLASVWQSVESAIMNALLYIEFGFSHWQEVGQMALVSAELAVVKFANQTVYFFTEVIPQYLSWFNTHWTEVFTDIVNFTATVATNIWANISNLWEAIVGVFEGKGFDFKWTPLTEGFKSAMTELPKIAERQMGPIEKGLSDKLGQIAGKVDQDFAAFAKDRGAKIAEQTGDLKNIAANGIGSILPKAPNAPQAGALANIAGGQKADLLAGGDGAKLGALVKGSAEAYKAAHASTAPLAQLNDTAKSQLDEQKKTNSILSGQGGDDSDSVDLDSIE